MEGSDLVKDVTCEEPTTSRRRWPTRSPKRPSACRRCGAPSGRCAWPPTTTASSPTSCAGSPRTAARCACFPASTPAAELLAWKPDGIFLSNGPGDPAAVTYAIDNVKLDRRHRRADRSASASGTSCWGLALGAKTYKLKFGHRGGNHPVKQLDSGKVEITSQNHGFAVDPDSLPANVA